MAAKATAARFQVGDLVVYNNQVRKVKAVKESEDGWKYDLE